MNGVSAAPSPSTSRSGPPRAHVRGNRFAHFGVAHLRRFALRGASHAPPATVFLRARFLIVRRMQHHHIRTVHVGGTVVVVPLQTSTHSFVHVGAPFDRAFTVTRERERTAGTQVTIRTLAQTERTLRTITVHERRTVLRRPQASRDLAPTRPAELARHQPLSRISPPVLRTYRRTTQPAPVGPPGGAPRSREWSPEDVRRAPLPPPPRAPVAVDVKALTDQVVRALDQRLIAYRERRGKV
jgi:hypothetical protein